MTGRERIDPHGSPGACTAWQRLLSRYWMSLVAIVFFACYAIPFSVSWQDKTWTKLFAVSARHMQAGERIHRDDEGDTYVYPPAIALVSIPLANLPKVPSLIGWYLLNVAAAVVAFTCAWKLAGGAALVGLRGKWVAVCGLGLALCGRFFLSPFENHQYDMIIAGMLLGGCTLIWRGRDLSGAALLGVCTALKCTPWLFGPYLLWRGKLKSAVVFGLVAGSLNVIPDVVFPQTNGNSYLADWYRETLSPAGKSSPGQWVHGGAPQSLNQSLGGLVHRFVTFGVMLSADAVPDHNQAALSPGQDRWLRRVLIYGIGLSLVVLTAASFGNPFRTLPTLSAREPFPLPLKEIRMGLECGAIVCLMLLLSPMSSKAHYAVMILPALVLARAAVELRERWLIALMAAMIAVGPLSVKGVLGKKLGDLALMWGCPTWYVLLTLAGICVISRRLSTARETGSLSQGAESSLSRAA